MNQYVERILRQQLKELEERFAQQQTAEIGAALKDKADRATAAYQQWVEKGQDLQTKIDAIRAFLA